MWATPATPTSWSSAGPDCRRRRAGPLAGWRAERAAARCACHRHQDRGEAREPAQEPVDRSQRSGHVVVGRTRHGDVAEPGRRQQAGQRPLGEDAQMAGDLAPGPAVDPVEAHLGEHGLDPERQQGPVVPGGEVGGGQDERASRPQHPSCLGQRAVGVHEVLDQFAHDDDVLAGVGQREPWRCRRRSRRHDAAPGRRTERGSRPVEADDPSLRTRCRRTGGDDRGSHDAVAAPHVGDVERARCASCQPGNQGGLASNCLRPRGQPEGGGRVLVEAGSAVSVNGRRTPGSGRCTRPPRCCR